MGRKVTIAPLFSCNKVVVTHFTNCFGKHVKRKRYNPYYTRDKIEGFYLFAISKFAKLIKFRQ